MEKCDEVLLPVFNGKDWEKWKFRLLLVLESKGIKSVVEQPMPQETVAKDGWIKSDTKARAVIVQCISNTQLELVINEKTASGMIEKFDNLYKPSSTSLKVLAKKRLLELRMREDDDPTEFINRFEHYVNELKWAGETINEEDHLNYLLLALPVARKLQSHC